MLAQFLFSAYYKLIRLDSNNRMATQESEIEPKDSQENPKNCSFSSLSSSSSSNTPIKLSPPKEKHDTPNKRFWGQESDTDSIYHIYLKKITYSSNDKNNELYHNVKDDNSKADDVLKKKSDRKTAKEEKDSHEERINQSNISISTKDIDFNYGDKKYKTTTDGIQSTCEIQCLQWETRQIRILKAATIEHLVEYILLLTPQQSSSRNIISNESPMEEERNDVSHMMHVLFCTYRVFISPVELFAIFLNHCQTASPSQMRIVFHYWLKEYPEDFFTRIGRDGRELKRKLKKPMKENQSLIDLLIACPFMDESLCKKAYDALKILKSRLSETECDELVGPRPPSKSILSLEPKFIAQQLTAIDLENFRSLKAYTLLLGPKRNKHVQNMIKNFNLLSRHVILTILKSYSPEVCTVHWINTAFHLRKIKNFNSLKAIIAGLTNESIYRLKNTVWNKLNKNIMSTFDSLSKIVDDVDNQTLLRQTQLEIEGTAKCSIVDESFGTIPYLGTFLTDLTVIDTKMSNFVESPHKNGKNLINLEKCSEQFEIITQINLLQKNIHASLDVYQHCREVLGVDGCLPQLPTKSVQIAPKVTRLFRVWFQDPLINEITENQCYQLSLALEPSPSQKK